MRTFIALGLGLILGILLTTALPARHPIRVLIGDVAGWLNSAEAPDDDALVGVHDEAADDEDGGSPDAAGDDDDDDIAVRDRNIEYEGVRAVGLTPAERALADITSVRAAVESVTPAFLARAEVANAAPALALTGRIRALGQELAVQRETEQALSDRLAAIQNAGASPAEKLRLTGELRQARRERIALAAELVQAKVTLAETFGPLAGALQANSVLAEALQNGESALLLLTLPVGERLPDGTRSVRVTMDTDAPDELGSAGEDVRDAEVLTPAPSTTGVSLGSRYFLKVTGASWVPGMLLTAHIPDPGRRVQGVVVPRSALVWHQGLRWVYIEPEENIFVRRQVAEAAPANAGRMVLDAGLDADDPIVVQGAQALLAEEFRTAIPEEDDD